MAEREIILASGSPRRRQILENLGIAFTVEPSDVDESFDPSLTPPQVVEMLAIRKAKTVAALHGTGLIIGSDTLVALENDILGKPKDATDAIATLRKLRGVSHIVCTGIALIDAATDQLASEVTVTTVTMRDYSDQEIADYVATGDPMDKAGSYGIQSLGGKLVDHYDGDLENVIGMSSQSL